MDAKKATTHNTYGAIKDKGGTKKEIHKDHRIFSTIRGGS